MATARASTFMTLDGYLAVKASIAAAFCGSLSKLKALMYALYSVGSRMTFRCCEVEWILARVSSRTKSGSVRLMERSFRVPWPKDLAISEDTIHTHKDLLKTGSASTGSASGNACRSQEK